MKAPDFTSSKSILRRYITATALILAAFGTRLALDPLLQNDLPFVFFLTSAVFAAWLGRLGAGLYGLVAGIILGDFFFSHPTGELDLHKSIEIISVVVPSLVAIFSIEFFHRATAKLRETEGRLRQAQAELKTYAAHLENRVRERTTELERSLKFLEGFCYTIAHNLRAPARTVHGFILALKVDYGHLLDATAQDYAERISRASCRMDRLIDDLLEYGQLSHRQLSFTRCDLSEYTEHIVAFLRKKDVFGKASVETKNPLGTVEADPGLLRQILRHLIQNALQHRDPRREPVIAIWSEEWGERIRFCVKDNGEGIAPEYQQKIFNMFEKLNAVEDASTGVGLAMVAKAVERMHGTIGLTSRVGIGSVFWFELSKYHDREKIFSR